MKIQFTNNRQYDFGTDLMNQVGGAASGGIAGAVGSVMGLPGKLLSNWIQGNQQEKFLQQQEAMNEKFANFSMGLQKGMWDYTNLENQVKHANAAGLNPALLYAKGGQGGSTGTTPAPAGMGIASPGNENTATIAAQQAAADIDLKKAQAENLRAQTPQTADLMQAQIASINQGINNQKAQEALTDAQTLTQKIQNSIQGETIDDQIATIRATSGQIENELQRAVRNNWIDKETMKDKIATIHGIMLSTFINNQLQKTNIQVNQQTLFTNMKRLSNEYIQLGINQQNADTETAKQRLQEYLHDVPDSNQNITNGLLKLIPSLSAHSIIKK